ncbi:MAG TPA: sodium:solute symporter family protein [Cyclobacteriaceae bacterium]
MQLSPLDWWVIIAFFLLVVVIGIWSYFKNTDAADYFVAGGKLPWWLSGISHHVSGYSGAVFVAYAGLAYTHGVSVYVWWALTIGIGMLITIGVFPVRWVRLRVKYKIQSPLEYLRVRYNLPAQQIMAWSGVLLKLFDVGAKWAAIAILLNVFTGADIMTGILLAGGVSMLYVTVGGLWGVILTDFAQFIVQVVAGLAMFRAAVMKLGGFNSIGGLWDRLPEANGQFFNEPYTVGFALAFLFINTLSYNGGTWSLATRYIASPDEKQAKRSGLLSAGLYLIWPLILFFPMWAAPLILPGLDDPTTSYGRLTLELLPEGLIGLVLASMFANTMTMTSSDANTIAAVIARDIWPALRNKPGTTDPRKALRTARVSTFIFTGGTIVVATQFEHFGGVLGLIVLWFGALVGPVAVPMLFGMLPPFRHSGSLAANGSILAGFAAFIVTKAIVVSPALAVSLPVILSATVFILLGLVNRRQPVRKEVDELLQSLKKETP